MIDGERQVAPTRAGIRRDHVARYEWAAGRIKSGRVIDLACGIGYGTQLMAERGLSVTGIDIDAGAIAYARKHYAYKGAYYSRADASKLPRLGAFDAAVCFETIEHVADPQPLLQALHKAAPLLIASVPNEDVMPYTGQQFHVRHYTPGQFALLLQRAGWEIIEWWGQRGPESEVEVNCMGRTIGVVARRARSKGRQARQKPAAVAVPKPLPKHVAILGMGPSVDSYTHLVKVSGGRHKVFDEVWTINALGNVFDCDRVFHMDDVRIQEIRAKARPDSNIAAMLGWLKKHPGPVYTSRPHADYPGLVAFPLEAVVNSTKSAYMNNTAAYAVALAVHLGVQKISVFGMDFTYPNAQQAEKGRACVEFWLGMASARGIVLGCAQASSLLDGCVPPEQKHYGYDTLHVGLERDEKGYITVALTERKEPLPTAEEIEHRYDHSRHPSLLVDPD